MSDERKLAYGWSEEDRAEQLVEMSAMHDEQSRKLQTSTDIEWLREQALCYRKAQSDAIDVVYEAGMLHAEIYAENERLRQALRQIRARLKQGGSTYFKITAINEMIASALIESPYALASDATPASENESAQS